MKIGIVGLGLIGGSLGLEFRSHHHTVLGADRRSETCQQALDWGVVDRASKDLELLADADVVFICTPLGAIESTVAALIPHLAAKTIITDVGSVKAPIVRAIELLWHNFVGGHPMAGKTECGISVAEQGLFAGKPYVLTPTPNTPYGAIETVADLARSLHSHVYQCRPDDHDRAVAWISHLPVMVSGSLIATCLSEADPTVRDLAEKFASSGFRDTSRVGGGNPELGLMMAQYNQKALLQSLHAYREQIDRVIQQLEQSDWNALEARLAQTQAARPRFLKEGAT